MQSRSGPARVILWGNIAPRTQSVKKRPQSHKHRTRDSRGSAINGRTIREVAPIRTCPSQIHIHHCPASASASAVDATVAPVRRTEHLNPIPGGVPVRRCAIPPPWYLAGKKASEECLEARDRCSSTSGASRLWKLSRITREHESASLVPGEFLASRPVLG